MRVSPPRSQPPFPLLSRRALLGAGLVAPVVIRPGRLRAQEPVDVELVLAVDVSRSVDAVEQAL